MTHLFLLLSLSMTTTQPASFYEHGKVFIKLLTCAEHTLGFEEGERDRIRNIAFDLSDAAKTLNNDDDMSFVAGITDQQEQFAVDAAKTQSFVFNSIDAQVSAYLTKDMCLSVEKQASELLTQLADVK